MAEYIEKQAAIKALMKHTGMTPIAKLEAETIICRIPTADVRPVRRGRWEKISGKEFPYWRCTACKEVHFLEPPNAKFCPGCAADMRGGDAE